jgi:hypothetical protein
MICCSLLTHVVLMFSVGELSGGQQMLTCWHLLLLISSSS